MFASGLAGAVNFLLLAVLTRLLSTEDYGLIGLLTATLGILGVVVGLNPHLLITVRFPVLTRERLRPLIGALVPVTLVTGAAALLVLEAVRSLWADFRFPHWVLLLLVGATILGVAFNAGLTVLQMQRRPGMYARVQVGAVLLGALVTLGLVVGAGLDWRGKFLGDVTGLSLFGLVMLVYLVRKGYLGLDFQGRHLREVLAFSAPLAVHALAFWAINAQDRYFVSAMVGLEANGLYTVAYAFGNILNIAHTSVIKAFNPFFYEHARDEAHRPAIVRLTVWYLLLSLAGWGIFVGAVWLLGPVFLGAAFRSSLVFIPLVALGYTFNAVRNFMAGYLYLAERTRLIGSLTLMAAILNGVLNYVLILRMGAIGAAISTAVTFAFLAAVTTWFAVRSWPMPWRAGIRSILRRGYTRSEPGKKEGLQ
jgi:O-antigen/teichoic acid export membrane protein